MAKRSKDPFEIFKQATLGPGASLRTARELDRDNHMSESDLTVETVQELVDTTPSDWKERCCSIIERTIAMAEAAVAENNSRVNQLLEMQKVFLSQVAN